MPFHLAFFKAYPLTNQLLSELRDWTDLSKSLKYKQTGSGNRFLFYCQLVLYHKTFSWLFSNTQKLVFWGDCGFIFANWNFPTRPPELLRRQLHPGSVTKNVHSPFMGTLHEVETLMRKYLKTFKNNSQSWITTSFLCLKKFSLFWVKLPLLSLVASSPGSPALQKDLRDVGVFFCF